MVGTGDHGVLRADGLVLAESHAKRQTKTLDVQPPTGSTDQEKGSSIDLSADFNWAGQTYT